MHPPLRILEIAEATLGGTGRHVLDLSEGLIADGHEVHLAYGLRRMTKDFSARLNNMPNLHRLPLDLRRGPHPADIGALIALRHYIKQEPFDIIHGHSSKGGLLARLAAAGGKTPCLYTPHAFITLDPAMKKLPRFIFSQAEHALGILTDAVIILCAQEHAHAREIGLPEHKLHRIANGIQPPTSLSRARIRRELVLPKDGTVLGFVGRLTPQKAPDRLVPLMRALRQHGVAAKLCVIGDGPGMTALRADISQSNLVDNIILSGERDGARAMVAFDLLVVPSRYESFPYIFLEALHQGVPVATMEVGSTGTGEVICNGENGLVVPQGDVEGFATAIARALKNPVFYEALSHNARLSARRFRADRMVAETANLYRRLVEQFTGEPVSARAAPEQPKRRLASAADPMSAPPLFPR